MSERIEETFAKAKAENRAALIPFVMGFDPDEETTAALLEALPKAGADLIEIGVPFSDPMADGPVIQAAGKRALAVGATLKGILAIVEKFRKTNQGTPIILMGYYNNFYRYGVSDFCKDAKTAGVDGVIIVDLPPEEDQEVRPFLEGADIKLIRLVAPTSDDERLKLLCDSASGFIYYISITGITGAKSASAESLHTKIGHLRKFTKLPVAAGFGIKTAEQGRDAAKVADAVVVGSALVNIISKNKNPIKAATDFVGELTKGLKR